MAKCNICGKEFKAVERNELFVGGTNKLFTCDSCKEEANEKLQERYEVKRWKKKRYENR